MRTLKKLSDDTELNSIFKTRKTSSFNVLYYSLWCDNSAEVTQLAEEWVKEEGDETVYLVNSWDLPHAFSTFSITSAPTLVKLHKGKVKVLIQFASVRSFFKTAGKGR